MNIRTRTHFFSFTTFLLVGLTLLGCATPQERAIQAYCEGEGAVKFPPHFIASSRQVMVIVGYRVVGTREVCETDTKTNTGTDHSKGREVRTCRKEDLTQPIYENRLEPISVDTNLGIRQNHIDLCVTKALAAGMFKKME